tara:strand:- start:42 stop:842 length:801 start_codon:yes stop_codon:yes gene_type:complete
MTIKIEFPADRTDIALAIGQALTAIGQGKALLNSPAPTTAAEDFKGQAAAEQNVADMMADEGTAHNAAQAGPTVEQEAEVDAAFEDSDIAGDTFGGKPEQSTAGPGADAAQGAAAASDNLDEKGVAFNGEFCSKAAQPFYGSGKKKGQWKKRQGVDERAYDDWYADELFSGKIEDTSKGETTSDSNVAANTFGSNNQQAATDEATPKDAGQLMKWVSEQQAAGNITQQQVTDVYSQLQLPFDAVMNPAYPVAQNCAAIYNHLKGQI